MLIRTLSSFILFMTLTYAQLSLSAVLMVDTDWLAKHKQDKNVILVDMSSDYTQYQRFHIPGAIYLGYDNLIQYNKKNKVAYSIKDAHLYKILGFLGIQQDTHVVIYDDMGGLNAGRLFWNLERIGHKKVSIVDGGLVKWILEGRRVDNKEVKPTRTVYIPNDKSYQNFASINDITELTKNKTGHLLDVRTKDEYEGLKKYPRTTGHIPGALFWPWEDNIDIKRGFILKDQNDIETTLQKLGTINKDDKLVLYCRSGHRAAQSYLTLRNLGYQNVKIYDGSMAEYALRKDLPIQQGSHP